jgi:hypothetical protein
MADTPSVQGIRYPKDYALSTLTLLTATGSMDLKNIMVELSYHEDLFNNVTSGYLMVSDSMGYIELLQMTGNEYLRVAFSKTANDPNGFDRLFRMYKVAKRKLENNMYTESYCLYFCSEEMILNEQYKVCRAYPNKTITDNIIDILQRDLNVPTNKLNESNFETSYGNYNFVVPTIKPFDAINWMSVYARPSDSKPGADMLLYENKFGFNFRSLQTLMDTSKNTVYNNYTYNPKNTSSIDIGHDAYNVLTYEIMNSFDSLGAINSGIFANRLMSIDPITRRTKITDFDYSKYTNELKARKLNSSPISNNFQNRFQDGLNNTPQSVFKLVFSNFGQRQVQYVQQQDPSANTIANDIYAETYIPYRTAQLALSNYTRIKISVPGDAALTVGLIVNFQLLSLNPNNKTIDPYYSGNYLITAVRHMITMNEYKTVLEISKESVTKAYASPDNTSSIWQNTSSGLLNV